MRAEKKGQRRTEKRVGGERERVWLVIRGRGKARGREKKGIQEEEMSTNIFGVSLRIDQPVVESCNGDRSHLLSVLQTIKLHSGLA